MPAVAYLANLFPTPLEPYVVDEIRQLRLHGVTVIPCSVRRQGQADLPSDLQLLAAETLYLQPLRMGHLFRAVWLGLRNASRLREIVHRIVLEGRETPVRRLRALLHTSLGCCYAARLEKLGVQHIHVHHGYFGAWVAMVAARLLGISFSLTLHGSDLLLHAAYLDAKLAACSFCVTVSEFNRQHILKHYPEVDPRKIVVQRMGVNGRECRPPTFQSKHSASGLSMLSVGRLHPVKDHAFLLRACRVLKERGLRFVCLIAGDGPERKALEKTIRDFSLHKEVRLLGQVAHNEVDDLYDLADLVVLTSRSEGIPLVLMEAMAHERVVLAPAITGIPELVRDGETGFLYPPGSLEEFVARVELIYQTHSALGPLRRAARHHVLEHFNRQKNLHVFCGFLISHLGHSQAHRPAIRK